jgi:hypothetical protein
MGTKGGLTSHADFFDGWDPAALDMVLDRCVRANVECRSRPDGNVYAGGTEQVIIPAGAIDSPSPRRRAKTACGQTASPVSPPTRMSPAPAASHPASRPMSLDAVVRSLQRSDPRRLARRRQVPHPLWFAGAGRVTLSWRLSSSAARALGMRTTSKGLVIGKGSLARHAEGCGRVQLRLTAAGQRALGQARRVRISVEASFSSVAGGRSTKSERAFTIKRR